MKNPNLENKDPIYIKIEETNGNILYQLSLSGHSIEDPTWVPLKFNPINQEKIILKIYSPTQNQPFISLGFNKKDDSLIYQSRYRINDFKQKLSKNIQKQKTKLTSSPYFWFFYFILILSLNFFLIQNNNKRRFI
jgi:hypothetical protein